MTRTLMRRLRRSYRTISNWPMQSERKTRIPCRGPPSGYWMHGRKHEEVERADSKSTGNKQGEDDKDIERNAQDSTS